MSPESTPASSTEALFIATSRTPRDRYPSVAALGARGRRSSRVAALAVTMVLVGLSAGASAHAGALQSEPPSLSEYFRLGVEHILGGFDHLVFLLGVVLIAARTREVLLSVTAFTLAHSITLGLAVLGLVEVSPRLVEPLIALSVAYVGLENFFIRSPKARPRLTFGFGLVHGLGFAGALRELGVPAERAGLALASFNLGVESGQLLVLLVLWPLLLWLRRSPRGYLLVARALNIALIALGAGWCLERTLNAETAAATVGPAPAAEPALPAEPASETAAVHSVYAADPPRSELAIELCTAFARLPRQRRAACSGDAIGVTLERECTRLLSAALASPALRVDPAAADRCIQAQLARYASCDFVDAKALPPLAECQSLWSGQLATGASCRSSLECDAGLYCHGLTPVQAGICGPAKRPGETCAQSVDPLASYLPNDHERHRQCSTACIDGRCSAK